MPTRVHRRLHATARGLLCTIAVAAVLRAYPGHAQTGLDAADSASPGRLCGDAVRAAELRYHLPPGLLFAISLVESGRPNPATHRLEPWPWTVQAEDRGLFFDSRSEAVQWVKDALSRGLSSIDVGCMQVNLWYHPRAFETLDAAFDPRRNADYAARFLVQLHASTGEWRPAVGFYHSQTRELAEPYEARVVQMLGGTGFPWPADKPATLLSKLADSWHATFAGGVPADDAGMGGRRDTPRAAAGLAGKTLSWNATR